MNIAVVGAGYVGVCTGVAAAENGHHVTIVDTDEDRVKAVREARAPFFEPGVDEALQRLVKRGSVEATSDVARAVRSSEVTFLCVGTPSLPSGAIDLAQVRSAAEAVGSALKGPDAYHVVVVKSTVVPGTTEDVVGPLVARASGRALPAAVGLAANPEFLREGSALADALRPDRIVIGAADERSGDAVARVYAGLACPIVRTTPRTAETVKYVTNAFLAMRVGLANEVANLCERVGVDVGDVMRGVGLDPRIGPRFLRAGAGFGGSCFPKDVRALAALARAVEAEPVLLETLLLANDRQPLRLVQMAKEALGDLRGKRIALLGLAFKPDTDDVRETRALPIHRALVKEGATVVCWDPKALDAFERYAGTRIERARDALAALDGADACILQTEWKELKDLPPKEFARRMRRPLVLDGRRAWDAQAMRAAGVDYRGIGAPRPR